MVRTIYIWLLGLHPANFREQFAEEILVFFDSAADRRTIAALFLDVFVSILRQQLFRREFREHALVAANSSGVPMFRTIHGDNPPPRALIHGALLSAAVLGAAVMAMDFSGSHRLGFLIGVRHPGLGIFQIDRFGFTESANATQIRLGPDPADPGRPIALYYFKAIRPLDALDLDHNLVISAAEIVAAPAALQRLDTDHNGELSAEECGFSLSHESRANFGSDFVNRARRNFMLLNPVLAALDTNNDGVISAAEWKNSSISLKKLDRNGDERLTPDELVPDVPTSQAALILSGLDLNGDGAISASERALTDATPLRRLLDDADRNHDGVTSRSELVDELRLRLERKKQFDQALAAGHFTSR